MVFDSQPLTQTQPLSTQPFSQPLSLFPSNLWGILLSCSTAPTTLQGTQGTAELERPARVELEKGRAEYRVGRLKHSNQVWLPAKGISNHHCRIFITEHGVRLEDTSSNGTYVRGKKVGKVNITPLESGDEIIFGLPTSDFNADFRYIFQSPMAITPLPPLVGIHASYELHSALGKGSFATVRKGTHRLTGDPVAIKIIQKARFVNQTKTMEMFGREVEVLRGLKHRYCVGFRDYFEDEQFIWIVLEYCAGGDLLDYAIKNNGISEIEAQQIARMVCEALAYLHNKGVAHRDIKPENLLLLNRPGEELVCKVTDFGLAKMVEGGTALRTMCGTLTYLAPEVLRLRNSHPSLGVGVEGEGAGGGTYGTAVDAWSVGCVLFSCLANLSPFEEDEEGEGAGMEEGGRVVDWKALDPFGISKLARDFIKCLLVEDPAKRMTVKEALSHPWLLPPSSSPPPLSPHSTTTTIITATTTMLSPPLVSTTGTTTASLVSENSFGYSQLVICSPVAVRGPTQGNGVRGIEMETEEGEGDLTILDERREGGSSAMIDSGSSELLFPPRIALPLLPSSPGETKDGKRPSPSSAFSDDEDSSDLSSVSSLSGGSSSSRSLIERGADRRIGKEEEITPRKGAPSASPAITTVTRSSSRTMTTRSKRPFEVDTPPSARGGSSKKRMVQIREQVLDLEEAGGRKILRRSTRVSGSAVVRSPDKTHQSTTAGEKEGKYERGGATRGRKVPRLS